MNFTSVNRTDFYLIAAGPSGLSSHRNIVFRPSCQNCHYPINTYFFSRVRILLYRMRIFFFSIFFFNLFMILLQYTHFFLACLLYISLLSSRLVFFCFRLISVHTSDDPTIPQNKTNYFQVFFFSFRLFNLIY